MNSSAVILIVDDEPKALLLLRNLIEPIGYRVCAAESGARALELAARERPDVILLDVMMPELDGYEVCSRMRDNPDLAAVPILLLTALDDRESRLRGLACGADDFITKPFDSAELRLRLRTITRLNRYRRLHEQSSRFADALAHAQEGYVLAELDGTILTRNATFDRLLSEAERHRTNFFEYLEPDEALRLQAALAAGTPSQKARECRLRFGHSNPTTVEIVHGLVPSERRTIVQFHLRDITEKKALESQLLRSQRIELLGQVSGGVIHDVNNVLAAIQCGVELLLLDPQPEPVRRQLGQIMGAAKRGTGMLRQLLMFARGSDASLEETDVAPVVEEVVHLVREAVTRWYPVEFEAAPALPRILADSTQLHQVVMNLCVNARDAMPDGGSTFVRLDVKQLSAAELAQAGHDGRPGAYVALSVRDQGSGMIPEVRERLFDPFFTTKPKGKGTGLGLATVLRVVRRHGGFITVDTELGRGTCFTCYFPALNSAVTCSVAHADQASS